MYKPLSYIQLLRTLNRSVDQKFTNPILEDEQTPTNTTYGYFLQHGQMATSATSNITDEESKMLSLNKTNRIHH
ncbi:hypothetical protein Hanom_Chr03g00264291 [Helianthus anomalus]